MFRLLKKVIILIMSAPFTRGYCILLENQECRVRNVIVDNDYMTFPCKIEVDRCIGSCNSKIKFLTIKFVYQIVLKILV